MRTVSKEKNRTAVLYSKEDVHSFLSNTPDVTSVYPITPNALAYIQGKTELPLLNTLDYFKQRRS